NRPDVLNPRDSIMTIANTLSRFGGGGTMSQLPLIYLNEMKRDNIDLVVYVSDSESWMKAAGYGNVGTQMMHEWRQLKVRNPKCKLVCIDLTPSANTQVLPDQDVLNVAGFSDDVFNVIRSFYETGSSDHWVQTIRVYWDAEANKPVDNAGELE